MTVQHLAARARRARLFNPPNGRDSTELEVRPTIDFERARLNRLAEITRERKAVERLRETLAQQKVLEEEAERKRLERLAKALEPSLVPTIPTVNAILTAVAAYYELLPIDMLSQRRERRLAHARQVAMYLARTLTTRTSVEIGRIMGGRDHTTVLFGIKKVEGLLRNSDQKLAAELTEIKTALGVE